MTLLAGFKTLLLARSGRSDICVATAMANRSRPGTERVIGPFANTAVICTRLDAALSFREALYRVRDAVLEAHAMQDLPFDLLAARLAEQDGLEPTSLVQVFFLLQNAFRQPLKLPEVAIQPLGDREGLQVMPIDRTLLTVILRETPSGLSGTCRFKPDVFKPNMLRNWLADYGKILAGAVANPKRSLGRLAEH